MRGGASTAHLGTLVSGSPLQGVGAAVSGAALGDCMLWGRARKLTGRSQEGWWWCARQARCSGDDGFCACGSWGLLAWEHEG